MKNKLLMGFPYVISVILMLGYQEITDKSYPYIIILFYVFYLVQLFVIYKRFLMVYSYIIFYITTNIIGVFLIETNNIFLNEIVMNSQNFNSLGLLVLVQMIFVEVIRLLYLSKKDLGYKGNINCNYTIRLGKLNINKINFIKLILFILFIIFLFLFLRVVNKPFFVVKLDRFLYQSQYLPSVINALSNSFLYFSPLIAIYAYFTKDKKIYTLIILAFVYFFWIGHKFSYFINVGYLIAIPFIMWGSYKVLRKSFRVGIIGIIVLILIVSIQSLVVYNRDFDDNIEYFKARLAQQGQLWWATYGLTNEEKNNVDEFSDEYKTYYKTSVPLNETYNSGMYKIMQLTTPYEVFKMKVEDKQSRYAYSTQASIYYYFKGIGLIVFSIISAIGYFYITNGLIKNILKMSIIPSILLARLFVIYNRALMQSDFNKLFSWEVVIILYGLLICFLLNITFRKIEIKKRNIIPKLNTNKIKMFN